jgi:tripartite-type tricarboxylate transporter receptor subunit TctC
MRLWRWLAAVVLLPLCFDLMAQTFPSRPVRIVVPFPAAGGADLLARAVAAELSRKWGQPVVVDNRAGGNAIIGTDHVAKSAPDGYTLLLTVNQPITLNPYLYRTLPYDPEKSFAPVIGLAQGANVVLAHPSLPVNNLKELVAYAARMPGKLNYASFGAGTQSNLVFETLKKRENINIVHVPYKGIAAAVQAVVTNEVQLLVVSPGSAAGQIKAGQVKLLAVTGKERLTGFGDLATTVEAGYPYAQASTWLGILAPAGTPPEIVAKINADTAAAIRQPAFAQQHIVARGWEVVASSPPAFSAAIRDEFTGLAEMFKAAGVQPE